MTLAGQDYLADYFRWSCMSVDAASDRFDMLVFHESNKKVKDVRCAPNVKFIDLGPDGLASLVVNTVLGSPGLSSVHSTQREAVLSLVQQVIRNIPRYLVEIKPMTGHMFQDYIKDYSHWTYTDPDIVWGHLSDWIDYDTVADFEICTSGKLTDAGRLFIRGQLALHRNSEPTNSLWKELDYFTSVSLAERMGNAVQQIEEARREGKLSGNGAKRVLELVFIRNFHSAEGWYSRAVFESPRQPRVLIMSLGFNDFEKMPVLLYKHRLLRCESKELEYCLEYAQEPKYMDDMTKAIASQKMLANGRKQAGKITPGVVKWDKKVGHTSP